MQCALATKPARGVGRRAPEGWKEGLLGEPVWGGGKGGLHTGAMLSRGKERALPGRLQTLPGGGGILKDSAPGRAGLALD